MTDRCIAFTVLGEPAPGGSKIHGRTKTGRTYLRDTSKRVRPWRESVAWYARAAMRGSPPLQGPVKLTLLFYRGRPKSHLRADGTLRPAAPVWPTSKPDLTKLIRPLEDSLRGIVIRDDAQVVETHACKNYGKVARVEVIVTALGAEPRFGHRAYDAASWADQAECNQPDPDRAEPEHDVCEGGQRGSA